MDSKKLEELRSSVEEMATESEFESMHFKDVERNILHLAAIRNLDANTAKLIAWLHDIARIKYGYRGKKHAREGRKEAKKILAKLGVDEKTIGTIARAIGNHRKKDRIDDQYSELVKDADCISHKTEFDGDIDDFEKLRCRLAEKGECRLERREEESTRKKLKDKWDDLEKLMKKAASGGADADTVHETRICIRKIRAILKTMKSGSVKSFEDDLKELFKKYSDPRECHVLRQHVIKAGKIKWLEERLEKVHESMISLLADEMASFEKRGARKEMRMKMLDILRDGQLSTTGARKVMDSYSDAVLCAETDDVETLHRMRIKGKTVKYLVELGLYDMDEECMRLVNSMHGEIGRLHDIDVNRALVNDAGYTGKRKLAHGEMKRMEEYFAKMEEKANSKISNSLFELKLRFRKLQK